MLSNFTLITSRRAILPNLAWRSFLLRPISTTPALYVTKKVVKSAAVKSKTRKEAESPKEKKAAAKESDEEETERVKVPKRRAMSVYNMFFKEQTQGTPGNMKDRAGDLAQKWKSLSDQERAPFKRLADEFNAIRAKAWSEWRSTASVAVLREHNRNIRGTKKRRIRIKSEELGSRPLNTYLRFLADYRIQHPRGEQPVLEYSTTAASAYHALRQDQKKVYQDAYHKDLKAWRQEQQRTA